MVEEIKKEEDNLGLPSEATPEEVFRFFSGIKPLFEGSKTGEDLEKYLPHEVAQALMRFNGMICQ